jgi:hypothetical protein
MRCELGIGTQRLQTKPRSATSSWPFRVTALPAVRAHHS